MKLLVVSAHSDDETFGCGGMIARHVDEGDKVDVSILSDSVTAQYSYADAIVERHEMAEKAMKILGVLRIFFHSFPDACLDTTGQLKINKALEEDIKSSSPDVVLTHSNHEVHRDHAFVHDSSVVAARLIKRVMSYEVPLSTTNVFRPNYFVDITKTFHLKEQAAREYYTEEKFIERIRRTAEYRGMQTGVDKAEAFFIERWIV